MSNYIERRPEAIEAIKKAIDKKWNPICMGLVDEEPACALCEAYPASGDCMRCPLGLAGMACNMHINNPYSAWDDENDCCNCLQTPSDCAYDCPELIYSSPEKAEAMLEALVMLLPPEHRAEYGG